MRLILIILFIFNTVIEIFSQNYSNTNYDLKYQRFEWEIDPEIMYVKGIVTSFFKITENNSSQIVFELADELNVDSVIFKNHNINYLLDNKHLIIYFNEFFPINYFDSISIYYQGIPPSKNSRAFEITNHNNVPIMWTLSEPFGAKDWFPCKQTLNDKIDSIDLIITAPKQYKVAGNGILISEQVINENKITHWKHNFPIAAYLIGIAITNYSVYSDYVTLNTGDTLEILNYVYPEDLDYSKINTPNIIDVFQYFSDTFLHYPFERYGHAQFSWGGGMEHQTMSFMLNFSHSLMAHELAHQWFGNYITCGSWHDIWLNESFATYFEGLSSERELAEYDWETWKLQKIYEATMTDNGSVYVYDTTDYTKIFIHSMVYAKGAMVLNTLRWELGDSIFFQSIKNYLNDENLKYNYAKTDDIKYHFENTSGIDLTEFFDDWIYSEGYPVYNIIWSQDDSNNLNIIVKQKQTHKSVDYFELKLPILLKGLVSDTLIILENNYNGEIYNFNIDFKITSAIFNPENDILTRGSEINQFFASKEDFTFTVSPNPANENLQINFPVRINIKKTEIYNSEGKTVFKEKLNLSTDIYNVEVSNLKEGIYIICIYTDKEQLTRKFVIIHDKK